MEKLKFVIPESGQQIAIGQLTKMYSPIHAFREYVVNGVDAVKRGLERGDIESGWVNVYTSKPCNRIIIQDVAAGMDEAKIRELPENIWVSKSRGESFTTGEKAIGMLAFGSMGPAVDFISREKGDNMYNHLRLEETEEGGVQTATPFFERLTETQVEQHYFGGFAHGTKALIQVNPAHFRNSLAPGALRKFIQATYAPLLLRNKAKPAKALEIYFGDIDKQEDAKEIEAPMYKGDIFVNSDDFPFTAGTRTTAREGNALVHLIFNPDSDKGAVALHEKDVRVWDSLGAKLDELAGTKLFSSPHVYGFVNTDGLILTPDRNNPETENHGWNNFVKTLRHVDSIYGENVARRTTKTKLNLEQRALDNAFTLVSKTFGESGDPLNKKTRRPPQPNPEPRPVPEPNPEPRPKKLSIINRAKHTPFDDPLKKHLRNDLGQDFGKSIALVNSKHPSYIGAREAGTKAYQEHLVECIASVVALAESKDAIEEQTISFNNPTDLANNVMNRAKNIVDAALRRKQK